MISVCLATHNGEKYIIPQLKSILSQIDSEDEIIISDDGSSDKTIELIRSLKDARIKIFIYNHNTFVRGEHHSIGYKVSANFQNAINHCSGDYIFLADQDDVWFPNKIESFLREFENGNEFIMSNLAVFENDDMSKNKYLFDKSPLSKSIIKTLVKDACFGCSMAFTRKIKDVVLPIPKNIVSYDIWIGMIACKYFKFTFIQEPTIYYRRHTSNVSEILGKSTNSLGYKIYWRVQMLYSYFVKRIFQIRVR